MPFQHLATTNLALKPQTQWLWYSNQSNGFVAGDERSAFLLPVANPSAAQALSPARQFTDPPKHACNLPIPAAMYEEFTAESWHGFRFLESAAYDRAIDEKGFAIGDILRTIVFGPDYGTYVRHPASGLILGLRSGAMKLMKQSGDAFTPIDETKTRGRAVLALAGHPSETLIAYGDNAGTFHAHRFDEKGFGKASKIAAKERKASRVEFVADGTMLAIGGMGYLSTFTINGAKFAPVHEASMPVRDFLWLDDGKLILVNQGMHGVSAYRYESSGFEKLGEMKTEGGAVQQMAVSADRKHLGVTIQDSPVLSLFSIA